MLLRQCFLAGMVAAGAALAAVPAAAQHSLDQSEAADAPFGDAPSLGDQELAATTGRENLTMIADAENQNTVSNNSVSGNSVTGTINVDGQAFQNLTGMAVINNNTGNNVAINASMLVNIAISPQQ